jgi:signal transduction histidine kinase
MFRRLKVKLTLINLALSCMVLLVVFFGINLVMFRVVDNKMGKLLADVAGNEAILQQRVSDWRQAILFNCFYLVTDKSGAVAEISPNIAMSGEYAAGLAQAALNAPKRHRSIQYGDAAFLYLKAPKGDGHIIVFLPENNMREVMRWLVAVSAEVGAVSLALVLVVSILLANRALVPVKNAWEKQQAFVADSSHELRTPLAVIGTNLELVMGNPRDSVESQQKWLGNIRSEVQRMSKLVEDLLFLARADAQEEALQKTRFDLGGSLSEAAKPFEPLAEEKGLSFVRDIRPGMEYYGIETRIKQLTVILLDNAFKHTPAGGRVELTASAGENSAVIRVADTGEGIPREHLDKIFRRFYRVDSSRSKQHGGSGLGLAIAECIAKEHGGSIHVSSSPGAGAEFKVTLPRF